MAKKHALRLQLSKSAAGSAADVLRYPDTGGVKDGQRVHIPLLSFEDETSACTEVQISAGQPGYMQRVAEQVSPAAGRTYWFPEEIVLSPGERLEVYFSGATAKDVLRVWGQGYWVEVTEDA